MGAYLWASPLRPRRGDWALRAHQFYEILRVGAWSSLSSVQTIVTAVLLTGLIGTFGTAALAGYGVGVRLELLQIPIVFAIGQALVVLVGTNIGAHQYKRARSIAWIGTATAVAVTLAVGASAAVFPAAWVRIFSDDPAVIDTGSVYFRIVAPFYPLFGAGMALYFASQGAGRVLLPVLAGTARLAFVGIGGIVVLHVAPSLAAIFAIVASGLAIFGVLTALAVFRARWERHRAKT
jgi:Na+-driven multidrug efflux pump